MTENGRLINVNPAMATILGYGSTDEALREGQNISKHIKAGKSVLNRLFRQLARGKQIRNREIQVVQTGGSTLWVSLNIMPILGPEGKLSKIEGTAEDITKRKEAEDKLARYHGRLEETVRLRTAEVIEKQNFLEEVLEGIKAAVIVFNRDNGKIVDCNSICEQLLGVDREGLIQTGHSIGANDKLFADLGEKSLNREFIASKPDGSVLPVLRNVLPVIYRGQEAFAVIIFDISERKALERQVNMAQKLQSIGQLAAGIAHEINTPIQYVGSNISFLSESFNQLLDIHRSYFELLEMAKRGEDISTLIDDAERRMEELDLQFLMEEIPHATTQSLAGVEQVASIVKALKQFAHPEQDNLTQVDINSSLDQAVTVSRNEWKYVAEVSFDLDPDQPVITGYSGPLNQVFLNMIVNAAHAIGERVGSSGDKGQIEIRTSQDDAGVIIEIADNGNGISPDKIQNIFDPFFTTKEVGKGTGQGLSIAFTIITEKHKGTIEVASTVGKGTTFTLRLPFQVVSG